MNRSRFRVYTITADFIILTFSYVLMTMLKPLGVRHYVPSHLPFFLLLALLWIIVSVASGKIGRGKIVNLRTLLTYVLSANLIATSLSALLLYAFRDLGYSRQVFFGTVLTATVVELAFGALYMAFRKAPLLQPAPEKLSERELVARTHTAKTDDIAPDPRLMVRLQEGCSRERAETMSSMVSCGETSRLAIVSTSDAFNIQNLEQGDYTCIINLKPMNNITGLDKFLDKINKRLTDDGIFLCSVETLEQRTRRLRKKFTPLGYYIIAIPDFLIKRVAPRMRITRGLWERMTNGANPPFSRAEVLGRLCRAGFSIRQEKYAGDLLCIKAQRKTDPFYANGNGYGFIIALPRVGRQGEIFNVYKLRTMHPYSEYIQDYVYDMHDLEEGGKLNHDFRVTTWGRFARRIWLDELPMIVNVMRGEIKLFGVRPLSNHYFSLYDDDLRDRRIQYKPGLLPPYYADMPTGLDGIQLSEMKYFDSWDKNPIGTDLRYFARSMYNIVFRSARSN